MLHVIERALSLRSSYDHSFAVEVYEDISDPGLIGWIKRHVGERTALVVTTPTVNRLYGTHIQKSFDYAGAKPEWIVLKCSEEKKKLEYVERVCLAASHAGLDRRGVLISLGGGVCSDIVTMASSMLRRGISHLRIPTTLIGQIDAGVGIKGGVNFGAHKNYLGCYHPPEAVAIVPSFLATVGSNGIRQGLAEMIKVACTSDVILFEQLERARPGEIESWVSSGDRRARELIVRSISAILCELERNPFERSGYERALDFGHTLAHPLEASTNYKLHHGFAVAIDLAFSALLAQGLGWLDAGSCRRIIGALTSSALPLWHEHLSLDFIRDAFRASAKHRGGEINMTLPTSIGTYAFLKREQQCSPGLIESILRSLRQLESQRSDGDLDLPSRACATKFPGAFVTQIKVAELP
jgi:3-dehydroquinate synthetase